MSKHAPRPRSDRRFIAASASEPCHIWGKKSIIHVGLTQRQEITPDKPSRK